MVKEYKKDQVKEIKHRLTSSEIALLTDYRGLDAHEMTDLRRKLREAGIDFKIFKNTLMRLAAKECQLEELSEVLQGPTAVAFGFDDPAVATKLLASFASEHEALKIKGGIISGEVIPLSTVETLVNLPSREELIVKLIGMVNAPIYRLVSVVSGPMRGLVNILSKVSENKT